MNGETVTVTYTPGNVRDLAGNAWSPSGSINISNNVPDTSSPTAFGFIWKFKRGSDAYALLTDEISLKDGDKLKIEFQSVDVTDCSFNAQSVSIGTGSGDSNEITTIAQPSSTVTNGFDCSMEYTIQSEDNGAITFSFTLFDGTNSNSVTAAPANSSGTAYTVTADNTAPNNISNIKWQYETVVVGGFSGEFSGGGGGSNWVDITSATTFGPDEKIKLA